MRLIIEARFDDGEGEAERDGSTIAATFDRRDKDLSKLGLTLAEGQSRRPGASHDFARSRPVRALQLYRERFVPGTPNGPPGQWRKRPAWEAA